MPEFLYRARGPGGEPVEGRLEAATAGAVAGQLAASGMTPVEIRPAAAGDGDVLQRLRERLRAQPPELTDLVLLSRQLYTLLRAGVPINQALTGLARSTRNARLAEVLREVHGAIESGHELSAALARHPRVFSSLYVAMVRVGEATGRLDEAFLKLSEYLEREKETRARVKSALRYPAFVVLAIAVAVAIINIVVVPAFAGVFARAGVALPLPTRVLIATSEFFVAWWHVLAAGLVLLVLAARWWVGTGGGRRQWDRLKLRLPLVGDILLRASLGRFARAFAMSVAAGVPLTEALQVVARAVDNRFLAERILAMRTSVERGEALTRAAAASGMFTPLVLQMLSVGEETGAVDELMHEVAGFYEREVDYDIRNLSATIEPVLIVFIAGMVLVLALGVFLPMWDLASAKLGGR